MSTVNNLKVVVLGTRGFPNVQGGVEAHCCNLYPCLAAFGCEVIVITRKPYINPHIKSYQNVSFVAVSCPKNKFSEAFLHTFLGLLIAKRLRPDILHIHAIGPALFIPFARILGLKVIFTNHGPDYERKKWNNFAKAILQIGEFLGCKCANAVICISQGITDMVKKRYGRDAIFIPNGVVIPDRLDDGNVLNKYGLQQGKFVLAVGRFVPEKGFRDLISAFKEMRRRTSSSVESWKLVIVGDADHQDQYSLELKDLAGQIPNVVLTGFLTVEPLQELYNNAGLFVLPSYYEGLPIVLLEAMSYGLSCIVSDIPANREVKLSEERYFKTGDINELALKMSKFILFTMPEKEKQAQIKLVKERYNWDSIAEETLEVYQEVIRNTPLWNGLLRRLTASSQ